MGTGNYRELIVWQKSVELSIEVYKLTEQFSNDERFGLISQMRRSAVSIPSNIAEGKLRIHVNEFKRFLRIAFGSGAELETQIIICKRLDKTKFLDYQRVDVLLDEIMRMLNSMLERLT